MWIDQERMDWGGDWTPAQYRDRASRPPRPVRTPGEYVAVVRDLAARRGIDLAGVDGRLIAPGYCHISPSALLGLHLVPGPPAGDRPSTWADSIPTAPIEAPLTGWLRYWAASQERPTIVGSSYNDVPEHTWACWRVGVRAGLLREYPGLAEVIVGWGDRLPAPRRVEAAIRVARSLGRDRAWSARGLGLRDLRGLARIRPACLRWVGMLRAVFPGPIDWTRMAARCAIWTAEIAPHARLWEALRAPAADWEPGLGSAIASAQAEVARLLGDARAWGADPAAVRDLEREAASCPREVEAWASLVDRARELEQAVEALLQPWEREDAWIAAVGDLLHSHNSAVGDAPAAVWTSTCWHAREGIRYADGRSRYGAYGGTLISSPTAARWWLRAAIRLLTGQGRPDGPIVPMQTRPVLTEPGSRAEALEIEAHTPLGSPAPGICVERIPRLEMGASGPSTPSIPTPARPGSWWAELEPADPGAARAEWEGQLEREARQHARPRRPVARPTTREGLLELPDPDVAGMARLAWAEEQVREQTRTWRDRPQRVARPEFASRWEAMEWT